MNNLDKDEPGFAFHVAAIEQLMIRKLLFYLFARMDYYVHFLTAEQPKSVNDITYLSLYVSINENKELTVVIVAF